MSQDSRSTSNLFATPSHASRRPSYQSGHRPSHSQVVFGQSGMRNSSSRDSMDLFGQSFLPSEPQLSPGAHGGFSSFTQTTGFPQASAAHPNANEVVLDSRNGDIIPRADPDLNDPMNRFWKSDSGPWVVGVDNVNQFTTTAGRQVMTRPYAYYPGHREAARSNPDSQMTGTRPPDSGYGGSRSVASADIHPDLQQEDARSMINGTEVLRLENVHHQYYPSRDQYPSTVPDQFDTPNPEQQGNVCHYEGCKSFGIAMNASDYKKHMQRHEKPFKCKHPGCPRREGFTTKNDLERHQKSLHKIAPQSSTDRSFMCQGQNCNKKNKIWPRLDNFKSHCKRMHRNEDADMLIKNSEIDNKANSPSALLLNSRDRDRVEEGNLLLGVSQGPHGQNGSEQGHSRGQGSVGMLDNIRVLDLNYKQPDRLYAPADGTTSMARSQSINLPHSSSQSSSPTSPGSSNQEPRRHSHASPAALRSPASNEALAESLQPLSPSKLGESSREPSSMDELSKVLASDLAKTLRSDSQLSQDTLQNLIASRLSQMSKTTSSKRSADEAGIQDDAATSGSSSRKQKVTCEKCSKTMGRLCDLKKHEKRHSRPWGCTNEGCNKSFGSKNDWKRHENSQHYQLETWRCHERSESSRINTCAKIFFRRDPFQAHLRKDHGITDEAHIRDECKNRRIGRNWQSGFWCGFCKRILKLNKKGLEAWDERFNHIDNEHFKKGERIESWYPLDKDVPKGELRNERARNKKGGGSGVSGGRDGVDPDSDEESGLDDFGGPLPSPHSAAAAPPPPVSTKEETRSTLREHQQLQQQQQSKAQQRSERKTNWFCSSCGFGAMLIDMNEHCTQCHHRRCQNCSQF